MEYSKYDMKILNVEETVRTIKWYMKSLFYQKLGVVQK